MGQYSSYYLYQKYEKRGSQDWMPCTPTIYSISGDSVNPMPLSVKNECDSQCGCSTTEYRWVNLDPSTDWWCDECPASDYTFTWDDGSTSKSKYGDRGYAGGSKLTLISKRGDTQVGFRIESTEGWEGVTESRYLPSTGSSSSSGTYLLAAHPLNSSGEDKQYKVTLVQNESGNRIYLFMTVQGMGGNQGFFFENMTATTINPVFQNNGYPSTGYAATIISHYNNTHTGFSISSDAAWLVGVYDEYVSGNDYYKMHYYPTGSTQSDRTATITLTQQGSGEHLYIVATQRGTGCTPTSTTCYTSVSNVRANEVAGTATTNTVTWDWSGTRTTRTTACTTADTTVTGSSSTTVTFTTNYGDAARTISGTIQWNVPTCNGGASLSVPYSFTQRRACHPSTAYCVTEITNVSADTVPAAATSNTVTWDWSGIRTIRNVECEESTALTQGSSSKEVTFEMNRTNSAITVSGTISWGAYHLCGQPTVYPAIPYSFTQKRNDSYVYITWTSQLTDLITIQRFIITFEGSSTKQYFTVNVGPIYRGSWQQSGVRVVWSTAKKMMIMEAEYTINGQSGYKKTVKLPQSSTYGINPTFNFSSQYFQGGLEANFTITP